MKTIKTILAWPSTFLSLDQQAFAKVGVTEKCEHTTHASFENDDVEIELPKDASKIGGNTPIVEHIRCNFDYSYEMLKAIVVVLLNICLTYDGTTDKRASKTRQKNLGSC